MLDARRRPMGRLFYCLLSILVVWAVAHTPMSVGTAPISTRLNDVVCRGRNSGFRNGLDLMAGVYNLSGSTSGGGEQEWVAGHGGRIGGRPGSEWFG